MPINNTVDIISISNPGIWAPDRFQLFQQQDYLDLRASFPDGTKNRAARFYANGDLQVAGEVFMQGGQIRSEQVMSLTVTGSGEDVVSFRGAGAFGAPGSEVLRVGSDGTLTSKFEGKLRLRSRAAVALSDTVTSLDPLFEFVSDNVPTGATQPYLRLASGGTTFLDVHRSGRIIFNSTNGNAAELELNATANTNGKKWAVSSTTSGDLLFENRTGSTSAQVSASGALRPLVRSGTPISGVVGDVFFDSGAGKLKVCVTAGAPGTWETVTSA